MKITRDYNADDLVNSIDNLISKVDTMEKDYDKSISTLKNISSSINFDGSWSDAVQKKVEAKVDSSKKKIELVDDDITSGNFQLLKNKIIELKTEAESFKSQKESLAARTIELNTEKRKSEETKDENRIASLERSITSCNSIIDRNVERINVLLDDISRIRFNEVFVEGELPPIMIEPIDAVPVEEDGNDNQGIEQQSISDWQNEIIAMEINETKTVYDADGNPYTIRCDIDGDYRVTDKNGDFVDMMQSLYIAKTYYKYNPCPQEDVPVEEPVEEDDQDDQVVEQPSIPDWQNELNAMETNETKTVYDADGNPYTVKCGIDGEYRVTDKNGDFVNMMQSSYIAETYYKYNPYPQEEDY